MKASKMLLIIALFLTTSCEKPVYEDESEDVIRKDTVINVTNVNNNTTTTNNTVIIVVVGDTSKPVNQGDLTWDFTNYSHVNIPEYAKFLGASYIRTDPVLGTIYSYRFSKSLHSFSRNPATVYAGGGSFFIASVYKGVDQIIFASAISEQFWYNKASNTFSPCSVTDHAGFSIEKISGGYMYFSVISATISVNGCPLKFIPAMYNKLTMEWAHVPNALVGEDIEFWNFNNGTARNLRL
jgi:hypothetical protein